jgi:hypothetical protein
LDRGPDLGPFAGFADDEHLVSGPAPRGSGWRVKGAVRVEHDDTPAKRAGRPGQDRGQGHRPGQAIVVEQFDQRAGRRAAAGQ